MMLGQLRRNRNWHGGLRQCALLERHWRVDYWAFGRRAGARRAFLRISIRKPYRRLQHSWERISGNAVGVLYPLGVSLPGGQRRLPFRGVYGALTAITPQAFA
jgi:hypothetical protein